MLPIIHSYTRIKCIYMLNVTKKILKYRNRRPWYTELQKAYFVTFPLEQMYELLYFFVLSLEMYYLSQSYVQVESVSSKWDDSVSPLRLIPSRSPSFFICISNHCSGSSNSCRICSRRTHSFTDNLSTHNTWIVNYNLEVDI